MDELLQFGYGTEKYVFKKAQQVSIQPTFGDFLANSNRLTGMDGGLYTQGYDRAPRAIGNVQAYYWLYADPDQATLVSDLEAIHTMAARGIQPLIKQIAGGTREVWTWAQVTNIQNAQSVQNVPHRRQQVQINFHCPLGTWLGHGSDLLVDNTNSILSDGLPTVVPNVDRVSVSNGDTVSVTNNGTTDTGVFIRWESSTGVLQNPQVSIKNGAGQVVNSVTYSATLAAADVVDIDCRNHLIYDNNAVVTGDYNELNVLTGEWLVIPPGTHTIDVTLGASSSGINRLTLDWWDAYL